jgi:hypothetical protein
MCSMKTHHHHQPAMLTHGMMYACTKWFSLYPSPPISVKQQEPGFIRPGNPVFLILSPLQMQYFAERRLSAAVPHSYQGTMSCALFYGSQFVSASFVLSSITCFSTLACRWLDVLWVVDHSWYTQETVELEKSSSVAVLNTLKPVCLSPTTIPRSKILQCLVLPIHPLNLGWKIPFIYTDWSGFNRWPQ